MKDINWKFVGVWTGIILISVLFWYGMIKLFF
jgi:hypothetical protein